MRTATFILMWIINGHPVEGYRVPNVGIYKCMRAANDWNQRVLANTELAYAVCTTKKLAPPIETPSIGQFPTKAVER